MSVTFASDVVLPAVADNTSLRKLRLHHDWEHPAPPEMLEAEALVAARSNGKR